VKIARTVVVLKGISTWDRRTARKSPSALCRSDGDTGDRYTDEPGASHG